MKTKINLNKLRFNSLLFVCLIYILMRPVLITYVTPAFKYVFILVLVSSFGLAMLHTSIIRLIGNVEIILIFMFYLYVVLNGLISGGVELLYYGVERYIFLSFPIFVIPFINDKINWRGVLKFLTVFGVVDALFSIYEFMTRVQIFPRANVLENITIQMSNYTIVRTYGLNGNYFLLAEILCVCGFAAYYLFKFEKNTKSLICLIIISIGVLTTGSRGYYISYVAGLLILFFSDATHKHISYTQILKFLAVCLLVVFALWFLLGTNYTFGISEVDTILTRIRQIFMWTGEDANNARLAHWDWALGQWKNNFFFGNGVCCTDTRYSKYVSVTESGVLKRLVELGLVGTVLQYMTLLYPLVRGIKKYRKSTFKDPMAIFFLTIIISFFIEDLILQRYTEFEYTIILWCSIAYVAYRQRSNNIMEIRGGEQ